MKTNRVKNSVLNAIVMIANTGLLSILALVSTNIILKNYGSDYNGVVSTANQFVNLILIVEGGFTTAINVSLFKPFVNNDQKKINQIMAAAKKVFLKIGFIFLTVGLIISLAYPCIIKSELPYLTIFLIFLMVMLGTSFNLLVVYKCQIMFQVSQREYIYSFVSMIINILSSVTTILLAYNKVDMLIIRLFILIYIIINGVLIALLFKKAFPNIENDEPDYKSIKGTKDIMVQKLTSVIYLSSPLLFISTFISTKVASVYAVYNSIYNIIKSVITSLIAAPVNGFGQLLSNTEKNVVYKKFELYEYIIIIASTILVSSVLALIIPFVRLYTINVVDINYVSFEIAILLALIVLFEVIHVPSGHIINVSGNFNVAKKIQIISVVVLVVLLTINGLCWGIIGILAATLITNILLAAMEIYYTHVKIFGSNPKSFVIKLLLNMLIIAIIVVAYNILNIDINSYYKFFAVGLVVFVIATVITISINYLFYRKNVMDIIGIIKKFVVREK